MPGNIISVAVDATASGNIISEALIDTCFPVSISSAFHYSIADIAMNA